MLMRLVATAIMSSVLTAGAQAQTSPETNQCVQAAYDLAQAAESKNLDDEKLDKIEDLLSKMEDLCDSDKVAEAMDVAKDIESEINEQ